MNRPNRKSRQECPVCGEGRLEPREATNQVEYRDHSEELRLHYSVCDECGSEITSAKQATANKRAMIAFRKRVDGLLSGEEIRDFREKFDLTQKDAATLLGGGKVAFSRYENDDVAQSEPMDSLLRLLIEAPVNLMILAREKAVELADSTIQKVSGNQNDAIRFMLPELPRIKASLDGSIVGRLHSSSIVKAYESFSARQELSSQNLTWSALPRSRVRRKTSSGSA